MKQKGFTLIETMVATAIGVIVLMGGATLYSNTYSGGARQESQLNLMHQNNTVADILSQKIRLAGYRPSDQLTQMGNISFPEKAASGSEPAWFSGQTINAVNGTSTDSLYIRYISDGTNTLKCDGTGTSGQTVTSVINIVNGNLTCDGVVLAENIENLQIQYAVEKEGLSKWTVKPDTFEAVKYVRFCVIAKNAGTKKIKGYNQNYLSCPSDPANTPTTLNVSDGVPRGRLQQVIQLRNNEEL